MSEGGEKARLFIAVELPEAAKAELAGLTSAVRELDIRGARTVRVEGLHLTLKFLGDVEVSEVPKIASGMDRAAEPVEAFGLALGETGTFPSGGGARVLWVGVEGDTDALGRLRESVEDCMAEAGFRRERRAFNPHITIGRVRDRVSRGDRRRVMEALSEKEVAATAIRVEGVSLMRSELRPDGARYERLHAAELGGGRPG